jgi:hypothetical protein
MCHLAFRKSVGKMPVGKMRCPQLGIVFSRSGFIDTAVTKIGDFVVDFVGEYEAIFKKVLTRVSRA